MGSNLDSQHKRRVRSSTAPTDLGEYVRDRESPDSIRTGTSKSKAGKISKPRKSRSKKEDGADVQKKVDSDSKVSVLRGGERVIRQRISKQELRIHKKVWIRWILKSAVSVNGYLSERPVGYEEIVSGKLARKYVGVGMAQALGLEADVEEI